METDQPLDNLTHDEIRDWLERALHGLEALPLAEPGEPLQLAVARLSKGVKPQTRQSIRDGSIALVRRFSEDGSGEPAYLKELLGLASLFEAEEVTPPLANLARRFPRVDLPADVRLEVLATLVDTPPPQPPRFWKEILAQDPKLYACRAFSGMLATDHTESIQLLTALPDDEGLGQVMARMVDFAWMEMTPNQRGPFVEGIRDIVESCQPRIAAALRIWIKTKEDAAPRRKNRALKDAIAGMLGEDFTAKFTEPKLVPADTWQAA
jgi:hypothetical protein